MFVIILPTREDDVSMSGRVESFVLQPLHPSIIHFLDLEATSLRELNVQNYLIGKQVLPQKLDYSNPSRIVAFFVSIKTLLTVLSFKQAF